MVQRPERHATIILLMLVGYLVLHLWSLTWFPFVHSDETWLASLSRTMWLERSTGATEEFFRLTPRHPHALKTLYHLVQAPLIMGAWDVVAARLPSMLAGFGAVVLVGALLHRLTGRILVALAMAAAFALDPQVFYISHLARQEAIVLAGMVGAIWILVRARETPERAVTGAAAAIGLLIFVHPNAFIAACAVTPWVIRHATLSQRVTENGRTTPGRLAALVFRFVAVLAGAALLAIAMSFNLDPRFLANYRAFGDSVGVSANLFQRTALLGEFFRKMAGRHAGTYYLAPVAPQLWALSVLTGISVVTLFFRRRWRSDPSPLIAVASAVMTVAGIFAIGKYSPPSIVFLMPWLYIGTGLLLAPGLERAKPVRVRRVTMVVLIMFPLLTGALLEGELYRWAPSRSAVPEDHYTRYIGRVRRSIPEGEVALANLNTAFAFNPGELRAWRDLGALPAVTERESAPLLERPLAQFLRDEEVRWIVIPVEELSMIYRERPVWNDVYGNPHRFYPDLIMLLERYGTRVDRFEANRYGMRLVPFMDRGPHFIEIYRLDLP